MTTVQSSKKWDEGGQDKDNWQNHMHKEKGDFQEKVRVKVISNFSEKNGGGVRAKNIKMHEEIRDKPKQCGDRISQGLYLLDKSLNTKETQKTTDQNNGLDTFW